MSRLKFGKRILAMVLSVALVTGNGEFAVFANAESAVDDSLASLLQADGEDIADGSRAAGETQGTSDGVDETEFCTVNADGSLDIKEEAIKAAIDQAQEGTITVSIPANVTTINAGIFDSGSELSAGISGIEIPEGSQLKTIGANAFQGSAITSLTIPAGVPLESIGDRAFARSSLVEFKYGSVKESAGEEESGLMALAEGDDGTTGEDGPSEGDSALTWGDAVFEDCGGLTTVVLPENTKEITKNMFKGCLILETLTIPENCTSVGESAFEGCVALQSIDFPESVEKIGDRALVDCKALKTVIIRQRGERNESVTDKDGNETILQCNVSDIALQPDLFGWLEEDSSGEKSLVSPTPSDRIVLQGYDGSVQEYAEDAGRSNYLKFESLFEENDYFILDRDGRLHLREDVSLPEEIHATLPDGAKIIPVGIFNETDDSTYHFVELTIGENSKLETIEGSESEPGVAGTGVFEKSSITQLTLPESVKEIPANTFKGSKLETITAEGLTQIGESAFEDASIRQIELPVDVTEIPANAFKNSKLEKITAEGVTQIGESAFADCSALTGSIDLPVVKTIGKSAFENCSALTGTINLQSVEEIGESAFAGCGKPNQNQSDTKTKLTFVFGASLNTLGEAAFQGSSVSMVGFGEVSAITEIPANAFDGCTELSEITIPESCIHIGTSAFKGCTALENIKIPESCTDIGSSAFEGCTALKNIDIPASVTQIGNAAFVGCTKLAEVWIRQCSDPEKEDETGESTIELWGTDEATGDWDVFDQETLTLYGYDGTVKAYAEAKGYTFVTLFKGNEWFTVDGKGVLHVRNKDTFALTVGTVELLPSARIIPNDIFKYNTNITGLTVPEGSELVTIEADAFAGSGITEFTVPKGVTEIQERTFLDAKIQTVTFEEGSLLERIGENAFSGSELKELKLPYTVVHSDGHDGIANSEETEAIGIVIGARAFYNCAKLETISLRAVTEVGESAFASCGGLSTIQWGKNLTVIKNAAFSGCSVTSLDLTVLDVTVSDTTVSDVTVPGTEQKGITWGIGVFEKCTALRTVTLPESMKTIPANMFKDCTALTALTLPNSCQVISSQAFLGCSSLPTVNIPVNVNTIGTKAFADCKSLILVTVYQQSAGEGSESNIAIAEDAFPVMRLTMQGYDGTVEAYAALKGYTFRSLFPTYTVGVEVINKSYGDAVVSRETARYGETIEVTVTPKTEYRLKASSFSCNGVRITKLKASTDTSQTFTFLMPDRNAVVTVEFEKDASYGKLSVSFEQVNNMSYVWDADNKALTFAEAGLAARLVVEGENSNPGSWNLTYSTTSSKVAKMDSDGTLYAVGKGSATVTAALKTDSSQKVTFKVSVLEDLEIGDIKLIVTGYDSSKAKYGEETIGAEEENASEDNTYVVLEYTKSTLQQAEQNFTVEVNVKGKNNSGNYFAKSEWKSSNTGVVTVDSATVYNNKNVVRIKKGSTGEACVTVTVGQKKRGVIIRVIDSTPRLVQSTLTLNSRSTDPKAAFELLPVYGYEVVSNSLKVVQAVKEDGITNYREWDYAQISDTHTEANKYYLALTQAGQTQIASKSGNQTYNNIFLQGSCRKGNEEAQTFYVPIKSVVLTNKALKPSVKLSGKINLFYNGKASTDDSGIVTITQSLKDMEVLQYRLLSAENYKAGKYKDPGEAVDPQDDTFANNFTVKDNQIVRSENELAKVKNKTVTSGYLGILYDGYNEFSWVKITVPTKTTKPAYVLSKTKATVSAGSTSYVIELKLLDKKTKNEISLADLDVENGGISINYSSSKTTTGLFCDFGEESGSGSWYSLTDNTICLRLDTVQNGKVTLDVQMATWSAPVAYTFKVNVTKGNPKVKAKSSTLTMNIYSDKGASTALTVTQEDVAIEGIEYVFLHSGRSDEDDPVDCGISLEYDSGKLTASGSEDVGRYRFRVTPRVKYANDEVGDAKSFVITVNVVAKPMYMKLKSASVTLNRLYWELDEREIAYTVRNMPTEDKVVGDSITVEGVNDASRAMADNVQFLLSDGKICVKLLSQKVSAGSYRFRAESVVTESGVAIEPFTITVKVVEKAAKVSVKANGAINMLDKTSAIKYTLTTSNVQVTPDESNVVVRELDTTNGRNIPYTDESGGYILKNFKSSVEEENGKKIIKIVAKGAEDSENSENNEEEEQSTLTASIYKLQFGLIVDQEKKTIIWSKDVNIKPRQTLPKIKTDVTEATFYAGVTGDRNSQELTLEQTTVTDAVISKVGLAKGNSDYLEEALQIGEFDPSTRKVKITLLRPDLLKANTTYTVKLEARIEGQMCNTAGAPFTVKIKVVN